MKMSDELRNARANQLEIIAGASPHLNFYTGSAPAQESDAATGTKTVDMTLPADWLSDSVAGLKSKVGTWSDPVADANGTIGYARLYKANNTDCVAQFTVGTSGAEINLLTLTVVAGQPVTIDSFSFTEGNP